MRELYSEELAIHVVPESCVGDPRGRSEALTKGCVRAGLLSRDISGSGCRRGETKRKATSLAAFSRAVSGPRAVEDPGHVRELPMRENREIRRSSGPKVGAGRAGKAEAVIP
jgi:hypothetical protein